MKKARGIIATIHLKLLNLIPIAKVDVVHIIIDHVLQNLM